MKPHLDFKLYLDAATQSVTRTRNSIYLLLTVLVVLLSVYIHSTFLDWPGARVEKMQKAYDCLSTPGILQTPECEEALRYAAELHLPQDINNPITIERYKEQLNAVLRRRTDLRTIQMPIFGVVLDVNDLGLVSSILLVILLIVLRANLYRELDDLTSAKNKVEALKLEEEDLGLYKERYEILSRVLVLSSPKRDNRGFRWSVMVVITLPIIIHTLISWNDWQTRQIAFILIGTWKSCLFFSIEGLGLILLFMLWFSNTKVWLKLAYLFYENEPPNWVNYFTKNVLVKSHFDRKEFKHNEIADTD